MFPREHPDINQAYITYAKYYDDNIIIDDVGAYRRLIAQVKYSQENEIMFYTVTWGHQILNQRCIPISELETVTYIENIHGLLCQQFISGNRHFIFGILGCIVSHYDKKHTIVSSKSERNDNLPATIYIWI